MLTVGRGSLCAVYWGVGLSWTAGCFGGVAEMFFCMLTVRILVFLCSPTLLHTSVKSVMF